MCKCMCFVTVCVCVNVFVCVCVSVKVFVSVCMCVYMFETIETVYLVDFPPHSGDVLHPQTPGQGQVRSKRLKADAQWALNLLPLIPVLHDMHIYTYS